MSDKPKTPCPQCGSTIHRTPDGFACDNVRCTWETYSPSFGKQAEKGEEK